MNRRGFVARIGRLAVGAAVGSVYEALVLAGFESLWRKA